MSTKENPGPFDGMERAEPGEPIFTLRAHDVLSAPLIHEWVSLKRAMIHAAFDAGTIPEEKRELELIQCREAEEIAFTMAEWRNGSAAVPVETEAAKPALYSGHTSSAEELAAKARFDVIKAAVGVIHNAVAEVTDAAKTLEPYDFASERSVILAGADRLKAVASHMAPKRASYSIMDGELEPFAEAPALDDPTTFSGLFLALHLVLRHPVDEPNRLYFSTRCGQAAELITPGILPVVN